MMRAALAVVSAYLAACFVAAPLVDVVGSALGGSVRGVARAVSPRALLSTAEHLPRIMLICLPGFLVLRPALFAARRVGPTFFALAGALNAHVALFVLTYPPLHWPGLTAPAVLFPAGVAAGLLYWGVERSVLGRRRVLVRGGRPG